MGRSQRAARVVRRGRAATCGGDMRRLRPRGAAGMQSRIAAEAGTGRATLTHSAGASWFPGWRASHHTQTTNGAVPATAKATATATVDHSSHAAASWGRAVACRKHGNPRATGSRARGVVVDGRSSVVERAAHADGSRALRGRGAAKRGAGTRSARSTRNLFHAPVALGGARGGPGCVSRAHRRTSCAGCRRRVGREAGAGSGRWAAGSRRRREERRGREEPQSGSRRVRVGADERR